MEIAFWRSTLHVFLMPLRLWNHAIWLIIIFFMYWYYSSFFSVSNLVCIWIIFFSLLFFFFFFTFFNVTFNMRLFSFFNPFNVFLPTFPSIGNKSLSRYIPFPFRKSPIVCQYERLNSAVPSSTSNFRFFFLVWIQTQVSVFGQCLCNKNEWEWVEPGLFFISRSIECEKNVTHQLYSLPVDCKYLVVQYCCPYYFGFSTFSSFTVFGIHLYYLLRITLWESDWLVLTPIRCFQRNVTIFEFSAYIYRFLVQSTNELLS